MVRINKMDKVTESEIRVDMELHDRPFEFSIFISELNRSTCDIHVVQIALPGETRDELNESLDYDRFAELFMSCYRGEEVLVPVDL